MDYQSLKQRLSFVNISSRLRMTVSRFPLALTFLGILAGLIAWMILRPNDTYAGQGVACYFLSVGFVLDFALTLWGEEQTNRIRRNAVKYCILGLWTAYCLWLELAPQDWLENLSQGFVIGNLAWIAAVIIAIPFVAFLRSKDDIKAWHMLSAICGSLFISAIITGIMVGGLEGLLGAIHALFDVKISEKVFGVTCAVSAILLFGVLLLSLIPYGEAKHNESTDMSRFLTGVMKWLILPLLGSYMAVLYAYMITIVVHWELPKGHISYLVSTVMIGFVAAYTILYPHIRSNNGRWAIVMTRLLPIIILPLLVLMTVGVVRRFMDYGLTASRLYLATLLGWYYVVCLLILLMPQKRFRWIFFSFGLLFLLSSGHPLHYYRLCRPVIEAKIAKIVTEKELPLPLNLYSLDNNPLLTEEEAKELHNDLIYMRSNYGEKSIEQWTGKGEETKEKETRREKIWEQDYTGSRSGESFTCPQGYAYFEQLHDSSYPDLQLPEDSLYNGALHVSIRVKDQTFVLLFDTAAIRCAMENKEWVHIHSSDGRAEYVLTGFKAYGYDDHTIDLSWYNGYIFYNE